MKKANGKATYPVAQSERYGIEAAEKSTLRWISTVEETKGTKCNLNILDKR
jgi:hypothetical protein